MKPSEEPEVGQLLYLRKKSSEIVVVFILSNQCTLQ